MSRHLLIIALTGILCAGCAGTKPSAGETATEATAENIETRIYQRLASDPQTARLRLRVESIDGIVTLSGRIDDAGKRLRAVSIVRGTPGVRAVIDDTRQY